MDRNDAHSIWSLIDCISRQLIKLGNHVVYCRFCDNCFPVKRDIPRGVEVYDIYVGKKKNKIDTLKQVWLFRQEFKEFLKNKNIDVVHTNFALPGAIARWVSQQQQIPIILTTHHESYNSMSKHLQWAVSQTQRFCDASVYISEQVLDTYYPLIGQAKRDRVIKNGIDISSMKKIKHNAVKRGKYVVCLGRLVPIKGQKTLIEAWEKVIKKVPEARLGIIGDGPDKLALEKYCQQLCIANKVEFTGWLTHEDSVKHISISDCIAIPSYDEGFGLVVAEAMALRVQIVCSDIPVFREIASDAVNYFEVGDANALAEQIIHALSFPEQANDKVDIAFARVAENYDQCNMIAKYIRLYDELLTEKGIV